MELPNKGEPQQAPRKKLDPVISGASPTSRPASKRFFGFLFAESPKALSKKIGREIVVPRMKASFEEAARGFLSGMLWGHGNPGMTSGIVQGTVLHGGTNYRAISSGPISALQQAQMATTGTSTSSGNYKDLICPTQHEAEILLARMWDLFNQYRIVTVADLYESARITPQPSDNSYGWTSLEGARIVPDRAGYVLQLPRPVLV